MLCTNLLIPQLYAFPQASKAALNTVVQIEPFKMFYKIEKGIKEAKYGKVKPEKSISASKISNQSSHPAGLSSLGFACFWPNGGGLIEKN